MTKSDMESLDAFHRKQLKQVWKITWKQKVTNEKLYRISKTKPLSKEIAKASCKLFGHVLRLHNATAVQRNIILRTTKIGRYLEEELGQQL